MCHKDYEFEIIYTKGKQNIVVDALSRKEEDVGDQNNNKSGVNKHYINFNNYLCNQTHSTIQQCTNHIKL